MKYYDEEVLRAIAALSLVVNDSRLWPEEQEDVERTLRILDKIRHKR